MPRTAELYVSRQKLTHHRALSFTSNLLMTSPFIEHAYEIFRAATPVIRIHGIGGKRWKRNVAKGARIGPWLQAKYDILNNPVWEARNPCLYLVAGGDGVIRYVGISRNRLKRADAFGSA